MIFERPPFLVAVPLAIAAAAALAYLARRRRIRAATAWSRELGTQSRLLGRHLAWWLAIIAGLIAAGIAGPRWGEAARTAESRALNIVLVMDVSRSMLAQDVAPNRLGRAVSSARRLVLDLAGDRFGLVAFSGHPYLLSPLTLDESAIALQLDALDPEMASTGGSGFGAALDLARKTLVNAPQGGDRAIVTFTDGETFESESVLAGIGAALKRARITLVAIPVGDSRGAKIPEGGGGFHRDARTGEDVITRRRDDLVQIVTQAANGVFVRADAADPVGDARRALARLNRAPASDRVAADLIPRAWICALVAALLLLGITLTRRSASLIALALVLGAGTLSAQRPDAGSRLLSRGDTAHARQAFTALAKSLSHSDTAWFNAGTSSLLAGDWGSAVVQLQAASLSLDPALRERALYNLGTAYLMEARRDSAQRDTLLAQAGKQLREALLLAPGDKKAKFNYELSHRLRPPPPPSGGGGGKGKGNSGKQAPPNPSGGGRGGMTPAEADQVLSAMERAERDTRQHQYARTRKGEPPLGPDW
jgi:Ca-activated chloride channel homolog